MVYNDAGDGGLPKGTNQIGGCGIIKLSGISGGGNHELRSENIVLVEMTGFGLGWMSLGTTTQTCWLHARPTNGLI